MIVSESASRILGEYIIESRLGEGGMGVVELAHHRHTKSRVAIKRLHSPNPQFADALRREVAALASIDHPSVVKVIDHVLDSEEPWYVMEFVEGEPLSDLMYGTGRTQVLTHASDFVTTGIWPTTDLANTASTFETSQDGTVAAIQNDVSWRGLIAVFLQICEALSTLHESGVIHRDLKPANILVQPDGRAVLVDFGIAAEAAGTSGRERITRTVSLAGTPTYMSPEQAHGESLDPRTDLYAFGCMLFELFTGQPPFVAESVIAILHKQISQPPPNVRDINPSVPIAIANLIDRLLLKNRGRRPAYAFDVDRILRRAIGIEPPTYNPPTYVPTPVFIGRKEEMRAAETFFIWSEQTLWVQGVMGIGKTRFVDESLRRFAREKYIVATAKAGTAPLVSMEPVFQTLADRHRLVSADLVASVGPSINVLAAISPTLATLQGVKPADLSHYSRRSLEAVLRAAFDKLIRFHILNTGQTVFVLDDAQTVDSTTFDYFLELSARHENVKVVIISRPGLENSRRANLQRLAPTCIDLGPLTLEEHTEMIHTMLSLDTIPTGYPELTYEHTSGVPYFLIDLAREAIRRGFIHRDARGDWRVGRALDFAKVLPMTSKLADELGIESKDMAPDLWAVAEAAAVLGKELSSCTLDALSGASYTMINGLFRRAILVVDPEDGVRFRTRRMQEYIISELSPERSRNLHLQAVDAIKKCMRGPCHAATALHLEAAARPGEAAVEYWEAAQEAMQRFQGQVALLYLQKYVELGDDISFKSLLATIQKLSLQLPHQFDTELVATVMDRIDDINDPRVRGLFLLKNTSAKCWSNGAEAADVWLDRALLALKNVQTPVVTAEIHSTRAYLELARGNLDTQEFHIRESVRFFQEAGERRHSARAQLRLSAVLRSRRRFSEAIKAGEGALASVDNAHVIDIVHQKAALGLTWLDYGDVDKAFDLLQDALTTARKEQFYDLIGMLSWGLANLHIRAKDFVTARKRLDDGALMLRYKISNYMPGIHAMLLGDVLAAEGSPEASRQIYLSSIATLGSKHPGTPFSKLYLARLERRVGNIEACTYHLDELDLILIEEPDPYLGILVETERGHAALAQGKDPHPHIQIAKVLADQSEFLDASEPLLALDGLMFALTDHSYFGEVPERVPKKLRDAVLDVSVADPH